jgi:TPR repeat protein
VAKDLAEAVKWYRKAAEQDVAEAKYNLGLCHANGDGVFHGDLSPNETKISCAGRGRASLRVEGL